MIHSSFPTQQQAAEGNGKKKPDGVLVIGGGVGGMLGGITSSLGGSLGDAGGLMSLAGGFSKLNLDSGMIGKFVPIILSFVQGKAGDGVKNLLAGVLKI